MTMSVAWSRTARLGLILHSALTSTSAQLSPLADAPSPNSLLSDLRAIQFPPQNGAPANPGLLSSFGGSGPAGGLGAGASMG
eukprot:CAMPEP_0179274258 /NCGR_PEP_ID=MMETSP0797-20121207/33434_1 /TAXON_ID=47934 /ORGANISM="Dinophysis acuminata, Strain DAEP01" /LENGTH=81 /DNA_ID=CAMNT_0020982707 /DNA_START=76 /DNA_END=317 /DNA_ORIENTATION=-